MNLSMTVSEIVHSYKQAKSKPKQIRILAELNGCDIPYIKDILIEQGFLNSVGKPLNKKPARSVSLSPSCQPKFGIKDNVCNSVSSSRRRKRRVYSDKDICNMAKMVADGASNSQIAQMYSDSTAGIANLLCRRGITRVNAFQWVLDHVDHSNSGEPEQIDLDPNVDKACILSDILAIKNHIASIESRLHKWQ